MILFSSSFFSFIFIPSLRFENEKWPEVSSVEVETFYASSLYFIKSGSKTISHKNQIWIVGGFDGEQYHNSVEMYNTKGNRWNLMKPMRTRRGGVGCAILNGYLYAIGGNDGLSRLKSVERLDLQHPEEGWQPVSPMNSRRSNFGVCSSGGRIIVAGGYEHPTTTAKYE